MSWARRRGGAAAGGGVIKGSPAAPDVDRITPSLTTAVAVDDDHKLKPKKLSPSYRWCRTLVTAGLLLLCAVAIAVAYSGAFVRYAPESNGGGGGEGGGSIGEAGRRLASGGGGVGSGTERRVAAELSVPAVNSAKDADRSATDADRNVQRKRRQREAKAAAVASVEQNVAVAVADDAIADNKAGRTSLADDARRLPSADSNFLHSMFSRLSTDPDFAHLSPRVISAGGPTANDPPWILVLDDFLSEGETRAAMEHLTGESRFSTSGLAGEAGNYNYNYRRSESMQCNRKCADEPWIGPLVSRMTQSIGLDWTYTQGMTLTHYEKGGFYGRHHDYILKETDPFLFRRRGNRILTFLVYLNDVEEGGATSFFHLGLDVEPRAGRALLFPNVFADRPRDKDERTAHEAKAVDRGEKYIAQTWFFYYSEQ